MEHKCWYCDHDRIRMSQEYVRYGNSDDYEEMLDNVQRTSDPNDSDVTEITSDASDLDDTENTDITITEVAATVRVTSVDIEAACDSFTTTVQDFQSLQHGFLGYVRFEDCVKKAAGCRNVNLENYLEKELKKHRAATLKRNEAKTCKTLYGGYKRPSSHIPRVDFVEASHKRFKT